MLLIYLPDVTSRTGYVFNLVFKNELGIEYVTTSDGAVFISHEGEKLNYSGQRIGGEMFIKASTLLFDNSIKEIDVSLQEENEKTRLFPNHEYCDMGFDIFAAVFYMVSRYEEYLPFVPDQHGRFSASDSFAYKNNFLQYPVVNLWIQNFKDVLLQKFPTFRFSPTSFNSIVTYDIDIAYKFKGRGIFRSLGSTAKDLLRLKFRNIFQRINSMLANEDPWDVYDDLKEKIKENNLDTIFFFLLGDYARYDKNIDHRHPLMSALIKKIAVFSPIGIHPSYSSSVKPGIIAIEKKRLEEVSNSPITRSRQHYLRFCLPGTYNELLKAGIKEDYSMGFTGMPGFRAGICTPFYFYDLTIEAETDLKLFPVTFMEGTFLEYLKISPQQALEKIKELTGEIKKVNGTFISIWHNNTVSNDGVFKDWKWVHDEMIKEILGPV